MDGEFLDRVMVVFNPTDKCIRCDNRKSWKGCRIYEMPWKQHSRLGGCAGRSKTVQGETKEFVDPMKASRKMAKGLAKSKQSSTDMGIKRKESKVKQERRDVR